MTSAAGPTGAGVDVFEPGLEPMVSYAQNGEDVVLRRAFQEIEDGFYVDVGAADPRADSVTNHFVQAGWSGVDVEPQPRHAADLRAARPGNVVVEAVVGAAAGRTTLHVVAVAPGRSSVSGTAVEAYRRLGVELVPLEVEVVTLAAICEQHRPAGPIHFLKIDAEGAEADVLAGGDWDRFRPMVVVLEVVNSGGEDESLVAAMVERGYHPVVFDGLNRFFVAEEHAELVPRLLAPANVNDRYEWYVHVDQVAHLRNQVAELRDEVGGLRDQVASLTRRDQPGPERPSAIDRVVGRLSAHRRWLAPDGSRRAAVGRRVVVSLRRPR